MCIKDFKIIYFLLILNIACTDNEEIKDLKQDCISDNFRIINSIELGEEQDDHPLYTLNLEHAVCFINRQNLVIIPYDTTELTYTLEKDIRGVVVNESDTILQIKNSFYRFYPSKKVLEHIFTTQAFVHNFCLTPNHGIGYMVQYSGWGPLFFEYFDFKKNTSKTYFNFIEFFPGDLSTYKHFQTYLDEGIMHLAIFNNVKQYTERENFYKVNLEDLSILQQKEFVDRKIGKVLNYNNFENIDIHFNITRLSIGDKKNSELGTLQLSDLSRQNLFRFASGFLSTHYFISNDFISISHRSSQPKAFTFELINWKTGSEFFNIQIPEDYKFNHNIHSYNDEIVLLYNNDLNKAIAFDKSGCKIFELVSKNLISDVIYMNDKIVITINEQDIFELFNIGR